MSLVHSEAMEPNGLNVSRSMFVLTVPTPPKTCLTLLPWVEGLAHKTTTFLYTAVHHYKTPSHTNT